MPGETHTHGESVQTEDILPLFDAVLDIAGDHDRPLVDLPLDDVGITDDLVLLDLWDVTVAEFGERVVGDLDFDSCREAATLGELAAAFAGQCHSVGSNGDTAHQGDRR